MKKSKGQYINIKVWLETRRKLRQIAALTDKNMVEVVDKLATEELQRLRKMESVKTEALGQERK